MKNIICILIVGFCALSCSKLPLPKEQQTDIAIQTACATMAVGDCFGEPALQSVLSGINADNCVNRIKNKEFIFSPKDIRNLRKPSCGKIFRGLGL